MSTRTLCSLAFLSLFTISVMAQQVSLAKLELESAGYIPENKDTPVFETGAILAGRFVPVHWVQLHVSTLFYITDTAAFLYNLNGQTDIGFVQFDGADLTFPGIGGGPWSMILFTGYLDNPASDSLFREYLKMEIEEPEFHGLPAGMAFSPESEIRGTGVALTGAPQNANVVTGLYAYWNDHTGNDVAYSFDARVGVAGQILVATVYGGVTLPGDGGKAVFRGGIASLARSGQSYELYAEAGLRQFDSGMEDLGKNMYLLFEPRMYLGKADVFLSFFSSPVFPENMGRNIAVEAENNFLGLNLLVATGNLDYNKWRAGASFLASMDPEDPGTITPFSFSISPFYTIRISDYTLDITAVLRPLHLDDIREAGEVRILLKAVY
ncbi:MAG TPA: hypothetical protein PLJ76_04845 [Treponemataceae bacterium]|nr:hypothetical protein [Treponemataceae bacterium]